MTRARIDILGHAWTVSLLPKAAFHRLAKREDVADEGAIAMCLTPPRRRLVFCAGKHLTLATIRHELTHAYMESLPYFSQGIASREQYEEMLCDLVGDWGPAICSQARKLYRQMRRP